MSFLAIVTIFEQYKIVINAAPKSAQIISLVFTFSKTSCTLPLDQSSKT